MELDRLFTKKNLMILELLEKENLHLREIAERLKISPAKVHGTIQLFKEHGIIKEIKDKNKKVIKLNKNNELLKNIENLVSSGVVIEEREETTPLFENISPLDYRYYGRDEKIKEKLKPCLSEEGAVKYLAKVEAALTRTLAKKGICSKAIADEVDDASKQLTAQEVYSEEDRIKHNIRALANSIRKRVSDKAKPYVFIDLTATLDYFFYFHFFSPLDLLLFYNSNSSPNPRLCR